MIRHPIFFRGENMYYIAYGSNLNKEEMKQRCKDCLLYTSDAADE